MRVFFPLKEREKIEDKIMEVSDTLYPNLCSKKWQMIWAGLYRRVRDYNREQKQNT